jgi:hypothetical protein
MAISNTTITIKKSSTTGRPSSLSPGELAYSYLSNTLFIGNTTSSAVNVGGVYYTSQIDNATSANTANTLVERDTNGAFAGRLLGNANTATALETARNFSIGGAGEITAPSVSFDGTGNVVLSANLNNTGVPAGTYGSGTVIPIITVDAKGRVTNIANIANPGGGGAGAVSLNFANTSSGSPYVSVSGGNTLNLFGSAGGGITTSISAANGISFAVDSTVARTSSGQTFTGNQIFTNDVSISGNLTVLGNSTIIRTSTLDIGDSLIYLANNNLTSDLVDIGLIAHYNDGANAHTGIFRDAVLKEWIFFSGYTPEVQSNNLINIADPSFVYANVYAGVFKGNVISTNITSGTLTLSTALGVSSGGTGRTSFTANGILYGNGTNAIASTGAPGSADQTFTNQILTVTNAGVPVWANTMDGGTF